VSYAIRRLEDQLGVKVLEINGRKAELTETGKLVLQRARELIRDASEIETIAHQARTGWEHSLRLVVDAAYPTSLLTQALELFVPQSHGTQVILNEVILSGAEDLFESGEADIIIGHQMPANKLGTEIMRIPFIAVAHRDHPLNQLDRAINEDDLRKQRQITVSDSGHQQRNIGWLSATQRWSVSSLHASRTLVISNMGFAWLPYHDIEQDLKQGIIKPISLPQGKSYHASLFLYFGRQSQPGPAAKMLADILSQCSENYQTDVQSYL
jgi:DNA-binding transcriptional LysR family regulator